MEKAHANVLHVQIARVNPTISCSALSIGLSLLRAAGVLLLAFSFLHPGAVGR